MWKSLFSHSIQTIDRTKDCIVITFFPLLPFHRNNQIWNVINLLAIFPYSYSLLVFARPFALFGSSSNKLNFSLFYLCENGIYELGRNEQKNRTKNRCQMEDLFRNTDFHSDKGFHSFQSLFSQLRHKNSCSTSLFWWIKSTAERKKRNYKRR